jgi:hypothetical protein
MNRINGITVMIEQVQVVSHYLHEPQLLPALNDKVNGRNSMSHSLVKRSSGFLRMHNVLYMGIKIFMFTITLFFLFFYLLLTLKCRPILPILTSSEFSHMFRGLHLYLLSYD